MTTDTDLSTGETAGEDGGSTGAGGDEADGEPPAGSTDAEPDSAETSAGADTDTDSEPDTGDEESGTDSEPEDADGDGILDADDCQPDDPTIYPGAPELCNGVDDDCDREIDESWAQLGTSCDGDDADECEDGVFVCTADGVDVSCDDGPETPGGQELCNGADDDCNGIADDPWVTDLGTPCDGPDADQCFGGVFVCAADGAGLECAGDMNVVEICNGGDDDCDGQLDEGCDDDMDDHCDAGMTVIGSPAVCNPALGEDCNDNDPNINPSADEICNGDDDDCDGQIDAADPDTAWPAPDSYEFNDIFFTAPELFEAADPTTPFGPPNPTSFHTMGEPDFFLWDDVVGPVPPPFMLCHISGMTGAMQVDVELGYRRSGDPALPYRHDIHDCNSLSNGDTCVLQVAPSFTGNNEYEFTVGVMPSGGIDQCNAEYSFECKLDYVNIW